MAQPPNHNIQYTDDDLLKHVAHRPDRMLDAGIIWEEIRKCSRLVPISGSSQLGALDHLPLEVLHGILHHVDVQTLLRFSLTSRGAATMIATLEKLWRLQKHAASAIKIMARAKVLGYHSLDALHTLLHTDRCSGCGHNGPFINIITLARCCYHCLLHDPTFWVLSPLTTEYCARLTAEQVSSLRCMWSVVGRQAKADKLISAIDAKKLAQSIHGPPQSSKLVWPPKSASIEKTRALSLWFRMANREPGTQDFCIRRVNEDNAFQYLVNDPLGATCFPSIIDCKVEWGLWCRGCDTNAWRYHHRTIDDTSIRQLIPDGCDIVTSFSRLQDRSWSRQAFLDHAKSCPSLKIVLKNRMSEYIFSYVEPEHDFEWVQQ